MVLRLIWFEKMSGSLTRTSWSSSIKSRIRQTAGLVSFRERMAPLPLMMLGCSMEMRYFSSLRLGQSRPFLLLSSRLLKLNFFKATYSVDVIGVLRYLALRMSRMKVVGFILALLYSSTFPNAPSPRFRMNSYSSPTISSTCIPAYNNRNSTGTTMQPHQPHTLHWLQLQRQLKEEQIITQSEAQQKSTFQKKLTSSLIVFHTSFIQFVQEADTSSKAGKKKILKDQGFGDAYTFVKEVILTLSKDFNIMAEIVRRNDQELSERWKPVSKLIVTNLFEDIVEEEINHKDIMYLMAGLLESIILGSPDAPGQLNFSQETVSCRILKDFTQRPDIKKYSHTVLKSTLLAISKVQHTLNLDETDLNLNKSKSNKEEKPLSQQEDMSARDLNQQPSDNWTQKYSWILRHYDHIKGHSKNSCDYVSRHLLLLLGVSDDSSLPSFQLVKQHLNPEPFTEELSTHSSFKSQQLSDNLSLIRNIICCFFGEVFKHIYSIPPSIRLLCKIIEQILVKRDQRIDRKEVFQCVGKFLFKTWLLPELKYQDKAMAVGLIHNNNTKNAEIVQEMILKIVNGDMIEKERPYREEVNRIITQLKQSVDNYLEEILKVDLKKVENLMGKVKEERIRSYSICLNYNEMRTIFQLILETQQFITPINEKIINRAKRVKDMTNDFELFKGIQDKEDGEYYDGNMAYVLFSQLSLPKDLQTDYYKNYVETYKSDKNKNLLRQILVSLDTNDLSLLEKSSDMTRFLDSLQKATKYKYDNANTDRVPLSLKVQHLISFKVPNFQALNTQMLAELKSRKPLIQVLYNQTKKQFLRATDSVRRYNMKVTQQQAKLHINNRMEKLKTFFTKATIDFCISSPKSRQKDSSYKSVLGKNQNVSNKDKIWSVPQGHCYHASSNLQYIKSLTGESRKDEKQCHCPDINRYLDTFSELPEVRGSVITGEDKVGIRNTFFDFINHVVSLIKADYKSNAILLEDEAWLGENLERLMTSRVYERIYPKHMTYDDAALYFRLKTLQWIIPEHLSITQTLQTDLLWKIAASTLNQIDNFKTPAQKMECIVACSQTMDNILRLTMQNNSLANADTTTPLIQYIILKAAPRKFYSNMSFISIFSQSNKMMSGDGYAFTQLQSGVNFLERLDERGLAGINKLEYQRMIYEKQTEYGLYFLKRRPRAGKEPLDEKKYKDLFLTYLS